MNSFLEGLVTIILAIVTVALVAVLVSKNAQTPQVAQSFFSGIGNTLGAAMSPVTGANISYNMSYPGSGFTMPSLPTFGG
ncbi:MAG: hypothetical protein IPK79_01380 [Vampirovibrionales bacterium]|nr:hypothetical protein [Vampirovibrionales bacterium]